MTYEKKCIGIKLMKSTCRRKKHKLVLFYKMYNNISPLYLSSLVPALVQSTSSYSLRNADDIRTINARTSQYSNYFSPQIFVNGTYPALTEIQIQLMFLNGI